jgi:hypothetical protein
MAALSPRRPTFDLPVIALSAAAIVLALWGLGMGDGSPEAKDRSQASQPASRPVALGGLFSVPIGVTGPATLGERLHAVPRLPAVELAETGEAPATR